MAMLLTTQQLAEALQVAEITIYRWRLQGMPFKKIGPKTFRYDLDEVMSWREQQGGKTNDTKA